MSFRPLRLHIGHHFFGAGNVGDDLMLAGFLVGITGAAAPLTPSAGTPGEGWGGGQGRRMKDEG